MKSIQLTLPRHQFYYKINIGNNILEECFKEIFSNYLEKSLYLVTNKTIDRLYPGIIEKITPHKIAVQKLVLPDGEKYKNINTLNAIFNFLAEKNANRRCIVVALGGGVVGDITGFAAATFMRGINFVQIPTTLLAQVDSSIGGKTGINHSAGKNFIGSFKQPLQTIIDVSFLKTLNQREFVAGYAELVKHGIIRDAYLFQILNRQDINILRSNKDILIDAIYRSCEVKAKVVESDERESNQRAVLNFGHTIGHFIETYTNYDQYLHGEVVIAGMDFAAFWSLKNNYLDKKEYKIIHNHLKSLGVTIKISPVEKNVFLEIVEHDKKSFSEGIRFVGLATLSSALIYEKITTESLWDFFKQYLSQDDSLITIQ